MIIFLVDQIDQNPHDHIIVQKSSDKPNLTKSKHKKRQKNSNLIIVDNRNGNIEDDDEEVVDRSKIELNLSDQIRLNEISPNNSVTSCDSNSSDEGIENPAIIDDEDEEDVDDDELLKNNTDSLEKPLTEIDVDSSTKDQYCRSPVANNQQTSRQYLSSKSNHFHQNHYPHHQQQQLHPPPHSHHQHHFNHHNQLITHYQQDLRKSPNVPILSPPQRPSSSQSIGNRTVSPLFPNSVNPDDVHQVELFLNGNNQKHLQTLEQEEIGLLREIEELYTEQNDSIDGLNLEDFDEELAEFQRIEREIKISELEKCLNLVRKQMESIKQKMNKEEQNKKSSEMFKMTNTDLDVDDTTLSINDDDDVDDQSSLFSTNQITTDISNISFTESDQHNHLIEK